MSLTHESGATSVVSADWSDEATDFPWRSTGTWLKGAKLGDLRDGKHFSDGAFEHGRDPDSCYRQEMQHFLDHVANGTATTNPIANAAETLRWALHARDLTRTVAA